MAQNAEALLASDMDGTVIPLEPGDRWKEDVVRFRMAVEGADSLRLAYVTGRDFSLAVKGMGEHGLPRPEYLVCDVGTSVYRARGDDFEPDGDYARRMERALDGVDADELDGTLRGVEGLTRQPRDRQTPFKFSYFLDAGLPHPSVLAQVRERLDAFRDRVQMIYSVRPGDGLGLVDILPAGVAKDFAVRYLGERTGVADDRMVYAGDSGNDLAAFLAGYSAIVVGNAEEALKEEVREASSEEGLEDRIYFARDPYAGGVLEGCRHFGVI